MLKIIIMKGFQQLRTVLVLILIGSGSSILAQQTEQQRVAAEQEQRAQDNLMRRMEAARGDSTPPRDASFPLYSVKKKNGETAHLPLYAAVGVPLSPEELAKITPANEDVLLFQDFLKKKNTGLAKIFPDPKCGSEFLVDLENLQCAAALSIPGRGAYFSFRVKKNYPFAYSDIHFEDGNFKVGGRSELGIISNVGNRNIDSIEPSSPEIAFFQRFKPEKTEAKIRVQELQVKRGFSENGFTYSDKAEVKVNDTYVVRTVAFRFYEQNFNDKRVDIIVVFRVVKQDADGALTILWRRLNKKESPFVTR